MQRSRKANLQRRAAMERNIFSGSKHFYKISVSCLAFSWLIIFMLYSLISQGNSYKDALSYSPDESISCESATYPDTELNQCKGLMVQDVSSTENDQKALLAEENSIGLVTEELTDEHSNTDEFAGEKEQATETGSSSDTKADAPLRNERLTRITTPGLDEFKVKAINTIEKRLPSQVTTVHHRMEPGGKDYNYASASKGAKVLDFNKEAKGANNILDKDKDKYLRNPCSAEEKFVVFELSEETLVDTIEIANFEHYSSNLKDFEMLSSLVYPTENWVKLGNFTAANVKHAQRFSLTQPKWARYIKLNLLTHYGTEFFCTLSLLEVYGVDAVEKMLENLISVEREKLEPEEQIDEQKAQQEEVDKEDSYQELDGEINNESHNDPQRPRRDILRLNVPDPLLETKPLVGRMPGDSVLKVLMLKVQSLDLNFSVLERYLEELNTRYGHIFKEFADEIAEKEFVLEKISLEMKNLKSNKDIIDNEIREFISWRTTVSSQLDLLVRENALFRSEIKRVVDRQTHMENKNFAIVFICFLFGFVAVTKLLIEILFTVSGICKSKSRTSSSCLLLFLSTIIITSVIVLL